MITAKEAREIPVKPYVHVLKEVDPLEEYCELYILNAAEEGLNSTEIFEMPDDLKDKLEKLGYKVEVTNIPDDPRMVCGWTISW